MIKNTPSIDTFKGLNNRVDPVRLGGQWLQAADNVDVTATGAVRRRDGYVRAIPGNTTDCYATRDQSRLYLMKDGDLVRVLPDMTTYPVAINVGNKPMAWAEQNRQVVFTNGEQSGLITEDGELRPLQWPMPPTPMLSAVSGDLPAGTYRVCCTYIMDDGRETGASAPNEITLGEQSALVIAADMDEWARSMGWRLGVYLAPANSTVFQWAYGTINAVNNWNHSANFLGRELATPFLSPLPDDVTALAFWRGRLYAAQPIAGTTAIWFSEPLAPHLFNLASGFLMVPGTVRMLAPTPGGLIIGTDAAIAVYDGETLTALAPYGVIPGRHWAEQADGNILFWSERGACRALPFANLTESAISVAPGTQACGALIAKDGETRYVVALHEGGAAFNPRSQA